MSLNSINIRFGCSSKTLFYIISCSWSRVVQMVECMFILYWWMIGSIPVAVGWLRSATDKNVRVSFVSCGSLNVGWHICLLKCSDFLLLSLSRALAKVPRLPNIFLLAVIWVPSIFHVFIWCVSSRPTWGNIELRWGQLQTMNNDLWMQARA